MKRLITNYTFDASAKTVTFTDYTNILLESVLLISNVTENVIIYNFADALKSGTTSTNVLTLSYDTTSMSDTDKLQIFYEVDGLDADSNTKVTLGTALSKTIDSVTSRPEGSTYANITASSLVRSGGGILVGMYVNSTSSGTIKFWDNTSAATTVINNTITPAVGWHNLGNTSFSTGLYATIGATLDVTIYYIPIS